MYEIITDDRNVKIYLDVEWPIAEGEDPEPKFRELKDAFENYVNTNIEPTIAKEYFWSVTKYVNKASYHLVVNGVMFKTKLEARGVAEDFRSSLTPEQVRKFTVNGKFIIDFNVYTKTQQFRMLYSTKLFPNKEVHPLLPVSETFKLTTANINQTLVQVPKSDEPLHFLSSHTGQSGSRQTPRKRTLYNPAAAPKKFNYKDVLPNEVIFRLNEITNNARITSCSSYDSNKYRICVSGYKRCVIKSTVHKNNNAFFEYFKDKDELYQDCWDQECMADRRARPNVRHLHPDEIDIFED